MSLLQSVQALQSDFAEGDENLAAVKGKPFAHFVKLAMHAAILSSLIARQGKDLEVLRREAIRSCLTRLLTAAAAAAAAAGIAKDDIPEALNIANKRYKKLHAL